MIDNNVKKRLLQLIDELEKRGGMYMYEENYHAVVNYLLGYEYAVATSGQGGVFHDFQEFINVKLGGKHSNTFWPYSIIRYIERDEKQALPVLFTLLHECYDDDVQPSVGLPGPLVN